MRSNEDVTARTLTFVLASESVAAGTRSQGTVRSRLFKHRAWATRGRGTNPYFHNVRLETISHDSSSKKNKSRKGQSRTQEGTLKLTATVSGKTRAKKVKVAAL
jgi:hypothetical protein